MMDVTPRNRNRIPKAVVYRSSPTQSHIIVGNKDIWGAKKQKEIN
jgi:hypothetical protein